MIMASNINFLAYWKASTSSSWPAYGDNGSPPSNAAKFSRLNKELHRKNHRKLMSFHIKCFLSDRRFFTISGSNLVY